MNCRRSLRARAYFTSRCRTKTKLLDGTSFCAFLSDSRASLVLSYKYSKRLFHHVYQFTTLKCTEEAGTTLVRIAPKILARVHDLQNKFLPKLSQAIKEITRNINFVEKEMQAEDIMLAEVCILFFH